MHAVCDFAIQQISFGYDYARATCTAFEAYQKRVGVCRDFAHLAVNLCRCLNIPARHCNGYLGDIGAPRDPAAMDLMPSSRCVCMMVMRGDGSPLMPSITCPGLGGL